MTFGSASGGGALVGEIIAAKSIDLKNGLSVTADDFEGYAETPEVGSSVLMLAGLGCISVAVISRARER